MARPPREKALSCYCQVQPHDVDSTSSAPPGYYFSSVVVQNVNGYLSNVRQLADTSREKLVNIPSTYPSRPVLTYTA